MVGEKKITWFTVLLYAFIILFSFSIIYPLLHILAVSLSENHYILAREVTFYPRGFRPNAYIMIWEATGLARAYFNTIFYVTAHTALAMFITTTAAYALSKSRRLWGYKFFAGMILFSMFFSGGMIPLYLTMRAYNLINSELAVIILYSANPFNILVMRTFFTQIPQELEEAGKIDGLNDFGVLRHVVLPLSKAVLSTITLFYAVAQWNAYLTPFIYLTDRDKWPVQILLRQMLLAGTAFSNEANNLGADSMLLGESIINATIIVSIIPMIIIYPFIQKYFAKGIMLGSVKG